MRAFAFALALFALPAFAQTPGVYVRDDGTLQGRATTLDCGTNLTCTVAGGIATITPAGGAAPPTGTGVRYVTAGVEDAASKSVTDLLDVIGSTRGAILYRGAAGWAILTPGTSGDVLTSNGAGADPSYTTVSGGSGLTNQQVMARLAVGGGY